MFGSKNNEILSISGIIKDYSMDNIPVRLIYDISIIKNAHNQTTAQETSKQQTNFKREELDEYMTSIILSHCKPIFSTNSIISLPKAIKLDKDNLLENIKINLEDLGVNVEKFSIDVFTTPEKRPTKERSKIITWLLNLIYILGSLSVIYIVYFLK